MKNKFDIDMDIDKACYLCEHAQPLYGGEFCACVKNGVVEASFSCRKFSFDPLKLKVTPPVIPHFSPEIFMEGK